MRSGLGSLAMVIGVGFGLLLGSTSKANAQTPEGDGATTLDGVYTEEQAERGRVTYQRACSACHTLDYYAGDVIRAWEGSPIFGLFEIISTRMPEDNPGSLGRRDYVDLLAYILQINGLPAGPDALPSGRSRLNAIRFKFEKENH